MSCMSGWAGLTRMSSVPNLTGWSFGADWARVSTETSRSGMTTPMMVMW
jgi:hypothetical protein